MNPARIAAVIGAAVISVAAGTAGAASATGPARPGSPAAQVRSAAPGAPGDMTAICLRMMRVYPAMTGMHAQTLRGAHGMGQMNQQMPGGRRGVTGGIPCHGGPAVP